MKKYYWLVGAILLLLVLALAACQQPTQAPPPAEPCPECPACPEAPECPEVPEAAAPVVANVPYEENWASSAHNEAEAEAFTHWNEDDPAEVPVDCARCHSTSGYLDFLGADGTAAGTVDSAKPVGETIQCAACHNEVTADLTSVTFPSGTVVEGLGPEARCMVCHQGRASSVQVNEAIDAAGLTADVDTVSEDLGFINIHYFPAGATLYGTVAKGGYEYEGKTYDFKNDHVAGYNTCIGCHDQHTLERKLDECAVCHQGVASDEDVRNIRMNGSAVDYDGDGDVTEGISFELDGLRELLLTAIQSYGTEVAGTAIVYDPAAYPYFFNDTNANGTADPDEAAFDNAYASWTARLLKAAYNYQMATKDPGAFAHGGKYIIELLYDSIEDLNQALSTPVDLTNANRVDAGHFAGSEEPFRHWDEDGAVPGTCAKCHSAAGLPTFLAEGVNVSEPLANGFNCATCHNDLSTFTRFTVDEVKFPSGAVLTFGEANDANLCINCHQGRESTVSVNNAINSSGAGDDEVSEALRFRNPHYFAAGATLFGTEAKGAYEFEGQSYNGRNLHVEGFNVCTACHTTHGLQVKAEACSACHTNVKTEEDLASIRMTPGDFDGDGDEAEGLAGEVLTMNEKLYAAIQAYATSTTGTGIVFDGLSYPYFFNDTNANGTADPEEAVSDNAFASWTPSLLRAAYNFQWAEKDPGAFAHNGLYMLQVLYDSLVEVGGDTAGMTRPAVKTTE